MLRRKSSIIRFLILFFVIVYPLYLYVYVYGASHQQQQQQQSTIINAADEEEPPLKDYSGQCRTQNVERNVDNNHRDNNQAYWTQLSDKSMRLYKFGWKDFIRQERAKSMPAFDRERGIVFVAGNDDTLRRTLGTIRLLRQQWQCQLPVEIWHMEHEAEAASAFLPQLNALGQVRLRDLSDFGLVRSISRMRNPSKQFQVKAAAIINSRFQHVLYLDSDNIPTRDPTYLFETVEYKEKGAIFWPDFWKTAGENKIFKILEIECQDTWEQESGQIVVDKKRHWLPLQLAWFLQFYHEVYFRLLNGDKDTFQYAWRALDAPFHRIDTFVAMGGLLVQGQFCGHSMLQFGPDNDEQPLFVHANLMKQIPQRAFPQRPWHLIKRYRDDRSNNYLTPQFNMINDTTKNVLMGCMNFAARTDDQESPSFIESFDEVLPRFQDQYFRLGGVGGYE